MLLVCSFIPNLMTQQRRGVLKEAFSGSVSLLQTRVPVNRCCMNPYTKKVIQNPIGWWLFGHLMSPLQIASSQSSGHPHVSHLRCGPESRIGYSRCIPWDRVIWVWNHHVGPKVPCLPSDLFRICRILHGSPCFSELLELDLHHGLGDQTPSHALCKTELVTSSTTNCCTPTHPTLLPPQNNNKSTNRQQKQQRTTAFSPGLSHLSRAKSTESNIDS